MAESHKPPSKRAAPTERLTKTELSWLLTQEARSAAQKLRMGVGISVPPETIPPPPPLEEGTGGVESTLNRLDEAVTMLASLHGHPIPRGRRGRIDLAALVWEVAPEARVQLEMGEGTSVFGDESELRRMLHVLIGHAGGPATAAGRPEVTIRREADEVRIGMTLGPDLPPIATERAWLSRMAIRYGGRLELDGATQTLTLPADVDNHRREVENLRRELAAAQAQGEAYARELAAVLRSETSPVPARTSWSASQQAPSGDALALLVAASRSVGAEVRGILSAIGRDIVPLRDRSGEVGEIIQSVGRHVTAASEIVTDLGRLGACPIGELPRHVDLAEVLRDVVRADTVRAARHDIRVRVEAPDGVYDAAPVGALTVLVHSLLDHAINASPPGSEVTIRLAEESGATVVTVDDAGPPWPHAIKGVLLSREIETLAQGRAVDLALLAAHTLASHVRGQLEMDAGPHGGARLTLTLPKMS